MSRRVQEATLVFLRRDDNVLLAMKKRGFGEGLWNGAGGKVEQGETPKQAAMRETEEEVGVVVDDLSKQIEIFFDYSGGQNEADFRVHVFVARKWHGEPTESEEMRPQWFSLAEIPYERMWDDDKYWLPKLLNGQQLHVRISFDMDNRVATYKDKEVDLGA